MPGNHLFCWLGLKETVIKFVHQSRAARQTKSKKDKESPLEFQNCSDLCKRSENSCGILASPIDRLCQTNFLTKLSYRSFLERVFLQNCVRNDVKRNNGCTQFRIESNWFPSSPIRSICPQIFAKLRQEANTAFPVQIDTPHTYRIRLLVSFVMLNRQS